MVDAHRLPLDQFVEEIFYRVFTSIYFEFILDCGTFDTSSAEAAHAVCLLENVVWPVC